MSTEICVTHRSIFINNSIPNSPETSASPGIIRHVLGQVGEQHGEVEADLFGRVMEALGELQVVDLAVVVLVTAHDQEVDLLTAGTRENGTSSVIDTKITHKNIHTSEK